MLCLIKYVSDEILINVVVALFICVDFNTNKQINSKKGPQGGLLIW